MESRASKRLAARLDAKLRAGGKEFPVIIGDLSETGLNIYFPVIEATSPDFYKKSHLTLILNPLGGEELSLSCRKLWSKELAEAPLVLSIGLEIIQPPIQYRQFYKNCFYKKRTEITRCPIAVVGIACYYPGAPTKNHLWENILARRREFRRLPDVRFPLEQYYDPDPAAVDKTYATRAAVIDGFEFNWIKHGIPKSVVQSSDFSHWLALDIALKALEDAGYSPANVPPDRSGAILGNTLTGEHSRAEGMRLRWPFVQKALQAAANDVGLSPDDLAALSDQMQSYYKSVFASVTEDTLAGNLSNTIAGRICNYINLNGGGYTVDGACSSSLIAVATAATALSHGSLDLAIAGGVDISLDTFELIGFAKTKALTKDDMRVYDRRASGFIPGEGAGFVVLKRLEDARAHGDYVYATLRGWALSSDGKGGLTAPKAATQALAIRRAYTGSGYNSFDLDFVEGHGTGTPAGDVAELTGIAMAMGDEREFLLRPCGVTSLKSIVGHTKAASGVGGFIKAVMAVNRRVIPPTANCSEPNPVFEREAGMLYPVLQGEIRERDAYLKAGISGMGFGGINCHVTVESADPPSASLETDLEERTLMVSNQETELIVLSGATEAELLKASQNARRDAKGLSVGDMVDFAAQLSTEVENATPFRAALIVDSPENLSERLLKLEQHLTEGMPLKKDIYVNPRRDLFVGRDSVHCRVGFLFPGQGSQQLNMARTLIERHTWARDFADEVSGWLKGEKESSLVQKVYLPVEKAVDQVQLDRWKAELAETETAQPAIALAAVLWLRKLRELGILPTAVGGHSLGELIAFHAAGAFDEESVVRLAAMRGRAMAAPEGRRGIMASLACPLNTAEEVLSQGDGYAIAANINGPRQVVISGEKGAVEQAVAAAERRGIQTRILNVSNAFHSGLVSAASDNLRREAPIPATLDRLQVKIFSGMGGRLVKPGLNLHDHFAKQVVSQVDFVSLVRALSKECDLLFEVGPGRILTGLANEITGGSLPCLPIESRPGRDHDLNTILAHFFVHGGDVRWPALYEGRLVRNFVPASRRIFVENPCERRMERPQSAAGEKPTRTVSTLPAAIADAVGVDRDVLSQYLARRGSFLGSVIKADLESSHIPIPASSKPAEDSASSSSETGATCDSDAAVSLGEEQAACTSKLLIELIAKRTGFPEESLSGEQRLLDDLNLDSIKSSELLAEAASRLGLSGEIDPASFANKTIAEVSEALDQLISDNVTPAGREQTRKAELAPPTWVRNFAVVHELTETPLLPSQDGSSAMQRETVRILSRPEEKGLAEGIAGEFTHMGASVEALLYGEEGQEESKAGSEKTTLVGILPRITEDEAPSRDRLMEAIDRLRAIVLAARKSDKEGPLRKVVFIQFKGGLFGRGAKSAPFDMSPSAALAASLHLERSDLKVRVLDFDPSINAAQLAKRVAAEFASEDSLVLAGYDVELNRRVPRLSLQEPTDYKNRDILWSSDDVVLVTGGGKGITAACALEFSKATKARMALVGSSPHPETENDAGRSTEISSVLERFRELEIVAQYYQCDIVDTSAVENLVGKIRQEMGQITGVIHGAALNRPRDLETVSSAEALDEVSPKVLGAMNLCCALNDVPPKLFIGFTSIIGVTGMARNGWYGFSNEVLDLLLRRFGEDHPDTTVQSMAFSIWDDVGMGVRLGSTAYLAKRGIAAIPAPEGVRRFLQLALNDPKEKQVVVTARITGLDTVLSVSHPLPRASRFLERVMFSQPGVEVVVRTRLSVEVDEYVLHHNWRGTYLFPTVFGLEAMAQAVAYLMGESRFGSYRIEDIRLERPIPVSEESGSEIEIRAEVLQQRPGEKGRRVEAVIGTERTGFSIPHFAATFVFGEESAAPFAKMHLPERPLDINPRRDLYNGRLLFQGPPFQRISEVCSLDSRDCLFRSRTTPSDEDGDESLMDGSRSPWLLGDPYFRDSLLHAGQLPVSQHICLPFTIKSIEHYKSEDDPSSPLFGMVHVEDRSDSEVHATVTAVNDRGQIIECLEGYVLKVLEYHEDYPTPEEIVDPSARDERILRREMKKHCARIGLEQPELAVLYAPGIHRMRKVERHKLVVPLLQSTAGRIEDPGRDISITWLDSGKPQLAGGGGINDISLSHNYGSVFCSAGKGPQGIDVEEVTSRTEEEWTGLLSKKNLPLLKGLVASGDSIDQAGTRIWSAREALFKATESDGLDLKVHARDGETVVFAGDGAEGHERILTFPVTLTRGSERIVAITAREVANKDTNLNKELPNLLAHKLNFDLESHKVNISEGPRGEPIFTLQFPVTFRETANPSRTLYFSQYFDWIGKLREFMVLPLYGDLVRSFSSGKWGMVTNHAETKITGEARSGDIIEGRLWLDRITGRARSTPEFRFEWRKVVPGGDPELIATSRMSTTWVAIRGHGLVEVQPLPEFGIMYLEKLLPPSPFDETSTDAAVSAVTSDLGEPVYEEPAGPAKTSALLREDIFQTALEDANLVGNIYFSNYYKWQGRTRDHFLHVALPEYFSDPIKKGELRCTKCGITHLSEAMPFDRITVRMYRVAVFERGVQFRFDYYRLMPDGGQQKLGHGDHEAVWYSPDAAGNWMPTKLPPSLGDALVPEKLKKGKPRLPATSKGGERNYDVIVIGAGIGGLTAGALLANRGKKVLLLEQHNKPGGFCSSFVRNVRYNGARLRFVFEAGVHDIATFGEHSTTQQILRELNIVDRIEWRHVEHEYFLPGYRIKVPRKLKNYLNVLSELFPQEREGLRAFFQEVESCFREVYGKHWEKEQGINLRIDKWRNVTFATMLGYYIQDRSLKKALSILAHYITDVPEKLGALTAIPLYGYYIEGGSYPKGGSQALSNALAASIEENGGKVYLRAPVSSIIIEDGFVRGVETKNGDSFISRAVISNADVRRTFMELVGGEKLPTHFRRRIETLRPSNSAFLVSLGLDFVPSVSPASFVLEGNEALAVLIPSKIDPMLVPPGCASVTLVMLVPYEDAVTWDRNDPNYSARKQQVGNKLIEIAEKAVPGLRKHIVYRQDASPATFARYAWTTGGSIYGLAIDEWRPPIKTPLNGLYLAGANATIRPGVEDAAYSGSAAANAVMEWIS